VDERHDDRGVYCNRIVALGRCRCILTRASAPVATRWPGRAIDFAHILVAGPRADGGARATDAARRAAGDARLAALVDDPLHA
jgi:hypothetical protein